MIFVLPNGTPVHIASGEILGTITGIMVRDRDKITYEVTWWDRRDRKTGWFAVSEIDPDTSRGASLLVGFGLKERDDA